MNEYQINLMMEEVEKLLLREGLIRADYPYTYLDLYAGLVTLNELAQTTRWYGECPVCPDAFQYKNEDLEDPDTNPHPHGLLCPECRKLGYSPVGVIHFEAKV